MQSFCEDLVNTSFVTFPASTAADLYDQYISDLGGVLDRHAPLICDRQACTIDFRKHQLDGCPIHIIGPNLSGVNLSACGVRIGLS